MIVLHGNREVGMTACSIHDCVEANCPSSRGSWSGTWWSVAACDPSSACPLRPSAWWWCYRPTESGVWWPGRIPTDRYHLDISRCLDINSHHSDIKSSLRYKQSSYSFVFFILFKKNLKLMLVHVLLRRLMELFPISYFTGSYKPIVLKVYV